MTLNADSMKQFNTIRAAVRDAINEATVTQTRVDAVSNVDDWGLDVQSERGLFEEFINDYIKATTDHVIQLKTRRNRLVAINKLPVEVFRSIFSHIDLPKNGDGNPFLSYTWVCRHWRSALIEDPNFWTSFTLKLGPDDRVINPFIHEYLRRSNSAKLDLTLTIKNMHTKLTSRIRDVITKDSHRIRRFWLSINQPNLIQPIFSNKNFASLETLTYSGRSTGLAALLPVVVESDQLKTLSCVLGSNFPSSGMDQLAIVLARIRHLSLDIYTPQMLRFVLKSINNSDKLQDLLLNKQDMHELGGVNISNQTIFPQLQYLSVNDSTILERLSTPKLSSLEIECVLLLEVMEYPIFKEINLSSIKYLYLLDTTNRRGLHSFLGLKERVTIGSSFTTQSSNFTQDRLLLEDFEDVFTVTDMASQNCPRDYFNFKFSTDEISDNIIELGLSALLPRMPNLKELYLLSFTLTWEVVTPMNEILTRIPSVEKLVIQKGEDLENFILLLNDPSVCPRLQYLFYTMSRKPDDLDNYGEETGKALTECLKARQKVNGNVLTFIALGHCPALPDSYLEELQSLGTKVITEG